MKLKVQIEGQVFEVEVDDLDARPIVATVDGERFEVWPEAAEVSSPVGAHGRAPLPQKGARMDEGISSEIGRQLRQEARSAAVATASQEAERWTRAAMAADELALLARLEQHLEQMSRAWAVHEKPLVSRVPLIGPLLTRLGSRLAGFLFQNQVAFNAQAASLLQELHQFQQLLTQKQVERGDDLFSRLDERVLALQARLQDLEQEIDRLQHKG